MCYSCQKCHFFEDENGQTTTVTGDNYRQMIRDFLMPAPDFFLWGYLKEKVYVNKPQTLDQLKTNIRQEIENIPVEMLKKVMKNSIKRADLCRTAKGGHLVDIIFEN